MTIVLILLLVNAAIGAFDTLYYHEFKAQLPHNLEHTKTELQLHAARDGIYFFVYGVLAFWEVRGVFAIILLFALAAEILITLADFVVEDRDRGAIGGLAPGERIAHTVMAITYGAMLAHLLPLVFAAVAEPTGLYRHGASAAFSWPVAAAALGIAVTGIRDFAALFGHLPERHVQQAWQEREAWRCLAAHDNAPKLPACDGR